MSTSKTIVRYAVVPEIDMPGTQAEKFNNSDVSWAEKKLGYNESVSAVVFDAVTAAGESLLEGIRTS